MSRRAVAACAALATACALAAGFGALPDARAQVSSATSGDTIHVARGPARALPTYVQVTRLDDSLFVLSAGTANMVACLADSGWVLVDTGTRAEAAMLREQVRRFFDRRFDFVIDTHVHDDHAGGNALYEGMGVPVLASDHARDLARTYASRVIAGAPKEIARLEACAAAQPASDTSSVRVHGFLDFMAQWWREGADDARHDPYVLAAPTLGFRGRTTHGRGSRRLEVRELPAGHTAGDCVVLFPEQRVAVVGDVFAKGSVPWADQFMMGGSMEGILAAQDSLLSWIPDDTTGGRLADHPGPRAAGVPRRPGGEPAGARGVAGLPAPGVRPGAASGDHGRGLPGGRVRSRSRRLCGMVVRRRLGKTQTARLAADSQIADKGLTAG